MTIDSGASGVGMHRFTASDAVTSNILPTTDWPAVAARTSDMSQLHTRSTWALSTDRHSGTGMLSFTAVYTRYDWYVKTLQNSLRQT